MESLKLLVLVVFLLHTFDSLAAKGDELVVIESLVNVRSEPSSESESILKLKKDRKVTEIQRQKNWVEVDLRRDDIKTGWIYKPLLAKTTASKNTSSRTPFDKFMQQFNVHNDVFKKQNGIIHFTKVIYKDKGDIELIATNVWLNSDIETRNNSLSEIFDLWSKFVPVGSSISIQVLDELGDQYTLMMR